MSSCASYVFMTKDFSSTNFGATSTTSAPSSSAESTDEFVEKHYRDIPSSALNLSETEDALLGQGGFATVYEASLSAANTPSALKAWIGKKLAFKKVRSTTLCKSARVRLQREAAMGSYLAHPLVITTLGGVIAPHRNGLLMEMAETTLLDVVEQYAQDEKTRIQERKPVDAKAQKTFYYKIACALLQTAQALEAIHAKGVVHCDVKPSNILITVDSKTDTLVVKIGDLGSCQLVNDVKALTRVSMLSGTLHYQAPESLSIPPKVLEQYKATTLRNTQVSAEHLRAHISARTDVWALGVTMLEVLNLGKNPITQLFKTDDELFLAMLPYNNRAQTRPLTGYPNSSGLVDTLSVSITSACPRMFTALAQKCLIVDPQERASLSQVRKGLEDIVAALRADLTAPSAAQEYRDVHVSLAPTRSDMHVKEYPATNIATALNAPQPFNMDLLRAALAAAVAVDAHQGGEDDDPSAHGLRALLQHAPAMRRMDMTGVTPTGRVYASNGALNGQPIFQGPRGGMFVVNGSNKKVYVKDNEVRDAPTPSRSAAAVAAQHLATPVRTPAPAPTPTPLGTPVRTSAPTSQHQSLTSHVRSPASTHPGTPTGTTYVSSGSANGRSLMQGPRGGLYYETDSGRRQYVSQTSTPTSTPAPAPAPAPAYSAPSTPARTAAYAAPTYSSPSYNPPSYSSYSSYSSPAPTPVRTAAPAPAPVASSSGSHGGVFSGSYHSSSGSANGRAIYTGSRGGQYYMTAGGNKKYI